MHCTACLMGVLTCELSAAQVVYAVSSVRAQYKINTPLDPDALSTQAVAIANISHGTTHSLSIWCCHTCYNTQVGLPWVYIPTRARNVAAYNSLYGPVHDWVKSRLDQGPTTTASGPAAAGSNSSNSSINQQQHGPKALAAVTCNMRH